MKSIIWISSVTDDPSQSCQHSLPMAGVSLLHRSGSSDREASLSSEPYGRKTSLNSSKTPRTGTGPVLEVARSTWALLRIAILSNLEEA